MLIIYGLLATTIWTVGYFHTGKYVRPKWKIPGKFLFYLIVSLLLVYWFKHLALFFIIGHPLIGLVFHIQVCKRHQINWLTCEPKGKYLQLQEKWAKGEY